MGLWGGEGNWEKGQPVGTKGENTFAVFTFQGNDTLKHCRRHSFQSMKDVLTNSDMFDMFPLKL